MREIVHKHILYILLTMLNFQALAFAHDEPASIDSRIRTLIYSENHIYQVAIHYGYQTSIEFDQGEIIQTISSGNHYAWQLSPLGRRLFIKPLEESIKTNMTILTNRRAYQFEIQSKPTSYIPDEEMVYVIRFFYPPEKDEQTVTRAKAEHSTEEMPEIQPYNFHYKATGDSRLIPVKVFDDGINTYFEFKDEYLVPKIKDSTKTTTIGRKGKYVVVNNLSSKFEILDGKDKATVLQQNAD